MRLMRYQTSTLACSRRRATFLTSYGAAPNAILVPGESCEGRLVMRLHQSERGVSSNQLVSGQEARHL